ncbi:MAG TPA: hypothetical protein VFF23_09335 [Hanamia sp.]|jgi:hypothetical protein|nr:hypothetical protein [Hanamia sp.]
MKKIFLLSCIISLLASCDSPGTQKEEVNSTTDTVDRSLATPTPYAASAGDVKFEDHNLYIYKGDKWVTTDKVQTMGNGVVVHTNGTITNGNLTDTLAEGEIVSHSGDLYDKAGNAIHDAWDAAKQGANTAADSVKSGVNAAGNAAKEGVKKAGDATDKGLSTAGQAANKAVKEAKDALDKK